MLSWTSIFRITWGFVRQETSQESENLRERSSVCVLTRPSEESQVWESCETHFSPFLSYRPLQESDSGQQLSPRKIHKQRLLHTILGVGLIVQRPRWSSFKENHKHPGLWLRMPTAPIDTWILNVHSRSLDPDSHQVDVLIIFHPVDWNHPANFPTAKQVLSLAVTIPSQPHSNPRASAAPSQHCPTFSLTDFQKKKEGRSGRCFKPFYNNIFLEIKTII